uniref:Uncharacterized protein n=1 Tax=Mustela putorius furo TaxID=9669 RepID=M3YML0_MUSPF
MMLSGWGLCIQKLHLQDLGIFQCFASNEGREIQTCTYLHTTTGQVSSWNSAGSAIR